MVVSERVMCDDILLCMRGISAHLYAVLYGSLCYELNMRGISTHLYSV